MQHLPDASILDARGPSRRDFLRSSALGAAGLSLGVMSPSARAAGGSAKACILIFNHGGPTQLETFDPKPDAPREVRGSFRPITAKGGGFQVSELLPRHAQVGDKFSLVRSVYHTGQAVHEEGSRLMQTGRPLADGSAPHLGSVVAYLQGGQNGLPAHVMLSQPGTPSATFEQDAGSLGVEHNPFVFDRDSSLTKLGLNHGGSFSQAFDLRKEPRQVRERYGLNRIGQNCLLARRLVEHGVRFVTFNTFDTVFHETSWDIHGSRPFSNMDALRDTVAPMYDQAYAALVEDLAQRGLLEQTMVAAIAEFGRTPKLNPAGGRDHWTHCWSVAFAGGGVKGGQAVGRSDAHAAYPVERPVQPAEVVATIYHSLGVELATALPTPAGARVPIVASGTQPIHELFS